MMLKVQILALILLMFEIKSVYLPAKKEKKGKRYVYKRKAIYAYASGW